jgi:Leucine-rich repeat (LRR) protein
LYQSAPLENCTGLKLLDFHDNLVENLVGLIRLTNLQKLNMSSNLINSIKGLLESLFLEKMDMDYKKTGRSRFLNAVKILSLLVEYISECWSLEKILITYNLITTLELILYLQKIKLLVLI